MKTKYILGIILTINILASCSGNKSEEKGFSINPETEDNENCDTAGISMDSLLLTTRPSSVLLTGIPQYRLTTIYKVNFNKKTETTYIGSNYFYKNYTEIGNSKGNHWHNNFIPGLEAIYGYNMVNVSHYDTKIRKSKNFFNSPVLIKTLYYPSFTNDTLNSIPVKRDYYMISVYDADTNKDGLINISDLRRIYYFDLNATTKISLVPANYSVLSSQYDPGNDFMYIYAKLDKNGNGKCDENEDIHIFWIDLNNPQNNGRQY